ncbi:glycoside hydrolase family 31 protein [Rhodohalobacter halophilus]|uniref:glycoside hydrolase family 31 protein n=1 Tax=Rhodohalobacter halophilus TaxID=1812810 RepID=UPI00083F9192|nr:DUF5110 domain-containing protein [Rhodohalobacter halophilus]
MSSTKVNWVLFIIVFLLAGCNRPPAADVYEANGIVSINAFSQNPGEFWSSDSTIVASSIVSDSLSEIRAGEVIYPFYIQNRGSYVLWLLGGSKNDGENLLQIRFLKESNETLSVHRVELASGNIPGWVNLDQITEEPIVLHAEEKGFYKLQLESGGTGGLIISKIHLSKDGSVIPTGAGYPETTDWRMEPEIEKRLLQARIPPSWVFGVISNQSGAASDARLFDDYYSGENPDHRDTTSGTILAQDLDRKDFRFYTDYTSFKNSMSETSNSRFFAFYPVNNLLDSNHKIFPLPWYRPAESAGFDALRQTVHLLSNPDRVTYESPWLHILPHWYDPHHQIDYDISEELMIRTMQLATFQNVMFTPFQSRDQAVGHRHYYRQLIDFRRRLFPYIYSYANRARTIGTKLLTGDRNHPDQFLFGDYLLVAPVIEEGAEKRELYLPEGSWYEYETDQRLEGEQQIEVDVSLHSIPLFVKAGAIIPKRPDGSLPITTNDNHQLLLEVYGGNSGTFRLYEDDGETLGYLSGEFSTIAYRYFEGDGYSTFNIGAQVNNFPNRRQKTEYQMYFKFVDEPRQITANGDILQRGEEGWSYNPDRQTLKLNWVQTDSERTQFRIDF